MKARPTQSRGGVKGQLPLAGSRDSVPCGAWGNAPTVPRVVSILYYFQIQLHHLLAPFPFWRPLIPLSVALLRCVSFTLARMKNSRRILVHFYLEIVLNALNKGAGSEASLPVTLRVRRRASKLLFPQDSVKNHSSTPPWHSYLKNKNGYCGGSRPHTVPVFLMQSRGDYSAAGAKKEICVAPVMASADSIVMGAVSTLSVAKEPS
jgi:hypothetical protein